MVSLTELTGSVASEVTNFAVPAQVETDGVTLLLVSVAPFPVLWMYQYRMIPKLVTDRLAGDLGRKTESPLSVFSRPNTGEIQVPGEGTVFNRARFDDRSIGTVPVLKPIVAKNRNRPLSSDSEPPGDTETYGHCFGGSFTCVMNVPIPNDTEVGD